MPATAGLLAEQDWRVLAVDVCADDPALAHRLSTRAELEATAGVAPDRIFDYVADVRDADALQRAVAEAERMWGAWTPPSRAPK